MTCEVRDQVVPLLRRLYRKGRSKVMPLLAQPLITSGRPIAPEGEIVYFQATTMIQNTIAEDVSVSERPDKVIYSKGAEPIV